MDEIIDRVLKAPPLQRWGGLAGLVVLITLLNFFLLVRPEFATLEQQAAQQRALDTQLQEKSEIAQNLNELRPFAAFWRATRMAVCLQER